VLHSEVEVLDVEVQVGVDELEKGTKVKRRSAQGVRAALGT
jgi:hypothetical protein